MLPSFERELRAKPGSLPRIYLLEVRDRDCPDGDPVEWVLVERSESRSLRADGSIITASIRLSFEPVRLMEKFGFATEEFFEGRYSVGPGGHDATVSITGQQVMVRDNSLRSRRIGTHVMNEVVLWARQWPTATVSTVSLSSVDDYIDKLHAHDTAGVDNKMRRNKLYENFGLNVVYDDNKANGHSLPMAAQDLKPRDTWERNIKVREVPEYIRELRMEIAAYRQLASGNKCDIAYLQKRIDDAEKSPVRWACRQLWNRYAAKIALLILCGLGVSAALKKFL